jgi:hypothetical protein
MMRRRRMAGEIGENRLALLDPRLGVALAEQRLVAGLVDVGPEQELAGLATLQPAEAPAGEDPRESLHVRLAVAAVDAERMQLERLARQVLVEALVAQPAAARVGPDGGGVVEIDQHRRMADRRLQHVGEAAGDMRPDRLALEGADQAGQHRLVGDRHGEVVAPEPRQPLEERRPRLDRRQRPLPHLVDIEGAQLLAEPALDERLVLDRLLQRAGLLAARPKPCQLRRQGGRRRELVLKPTLRIAVDAREIAGLRAEAEAVDGDEGAGPCCCGHCRVHLPSASARLPSGDSSGTASLTIPSSLSCSATLRARTSS